MSDLSVLQFLLCVCLSVCFLKWFTFWDIFQTKDQLISDKSGYG